MLRVAVLALLWGSGYLWTGLALRHGLSPLHITVVRAVLGAGVLLLLARLSRQHLPRGAGVWRRIAVAALLCNTLPFFLAAQGVRTVSTGLAGVLNATTPLWSLLIGLALGTERDRRPVRFAGLLLGFAGVLLIFSPWSAPSSSAAGGSTGWGVLALLGAALSYAVAFAYMGRYLTGTGTGAGTGDGTDARAGGGTGPLAVSAAQLTAAAGLGALALPAGGTSTGWTDPVALAAVAVLGIFCTGFTFHLNYRLIALEGPTAAATVGYLLPVVSTALGALVLHEPLGARTVAGMAVVLAGVHLARHRRHAPTPPTTSVPAAASVPAASSASVPAPPAASVPAAPAASVPAASSASVPAAPAASVPAAASASVPAAPAASVPA
ncbi:DMT family transporter, partial [Streptomyces tricolor]|uniref:DMT family transporter n=1 Tax=Streptomyces tricolor TaxID=68277 RepID=UPI002F3FF138